MPGQKKDFKSFTTLQKTQLCEQLGWNIGKELYNLILSSSDAFVELNTIFKQHYIEVIEHYFYEIYQYNDDSKLYNMAQNYCRVNDLHFTKSDIIRPSKKHVLVMFLLGKPFKQLHNNKDKTTQDPKKLLEIVIQSNAEVIKFQLKQYKINDAASFFKRMNSSIYNVIGPMLFSALVGNKTKSNYNLFTVRQKVMLCDNLGRSAGRLIYTLITSKQDFLSRIYDLFKTNSVNIMQITLKDILKQDTNNSIYESVQDYIQNNNITISKDDAKRRSKNFILITLLLQKTYKKTTDDRFLASDGQVVSYSQLANQANNKIRKHQFRQSQKINPGII